MGRMSRKAIASRALSRACLAIAIVFALGGCATQTLTAGQTLAKAGEAAATQMQQNALVSSDNLQSFKGAVAFNDGYNNDIGDPNSARLLGSIADIQTKLASLSKMLSSLGAVYTDLGNLSSYDASGSFNSSLSSLTQAANGACAAFGSPACVPGAAATVGGSLGGFVLQEMQANDVKAGSAAIRVVLQNVITVLDSSTQRDALVLDKQLVNGQLDQASAVLFNSGTFSYDPLIDELGAPLGFKSTTNSDTAVRGSAKLKAGLNNVVLQSADAQLDAIGASYDASLAALKALIPQHQKLENGAPLDTSTITAITAQLQVIATALTPSKGN